MASDLKKAVAAIEVADLQRSLAHLTRDDRRELHRALNTQLKGANAGALLRARLTATGDEARAGAMAALGRPVLRLLRHDLGDERFESPTDDDLAEALPRAVGAFGAPMVAATFTLLVGDEVPAAPVLARALEGGLEVEPAEVADDELRATMAALEERDRALDAVGDTGPDDPPPPPPPPPPPADVVEPAPPAGEPTDGDDDGGDLAHDLAGVIALDPGDVEEPLFSPLDVLVVTTVVASGHGQVGAPDPAELRALVDEVVSLNASRTASWFHPGFLSALDEGYAPPRTDGLNAERRRWYWFGRLSGLVRLGDPDALVAEVLEHGREVRAVLADDRMGQQLTTPVVLALVRDHPLEATVMLDERGWDFAESRRALDGVFQRGRLLLAERRVDEAERVFTSLRPYASSGLLVPDGDDGADFGLDLQRRIASCRRAVDDFHGAQQALDRLDAGGGGPVDQAHLAAERGLVAARIGHLGHLDFPADADSAAVLAERLEAGREHFEQALALATEARAALCLGLLAFCRDDLKPAAAHLEVAASAMYDDVVYQRSGVVDAARFHVGVCQLWTSDEPVDGPAWSLMSDAVERGYRPPPRSVGMAAEGLALKSSKHTVPFLRRARELVPTVDPLLDAIKGALVSDRPGAAELAVDLAPELPLSPTARFDLLSKAVSAAARLQDPQTVSEAIEQLDDVVAAASDNDLLRRWAELLDGDEAVRAVLGAREADLAAVEQHRALGDPSAAAERARKVLHHLLTHPSPHHDPLDLLDLLDELGVDGEELRALRDQVQRTTERVDVDEVQRAADLAPIDILFVGGNEVQQRYEEAITAEVRRRYGGKVRVEWEFPGWSPNWAPVADRVEARYGPSTALVLMQFVRTNLGRRLRRTSGEHGVPWVACTGHGRAAIQRAIERGVEVAAAKRRHD